jgi:hypothetical protein
VKLALQLAGTLALVALGWLCVEGALTVHALRPHALVTLENIDRVTIVAGVTASEVQKGALAWQQASADQSKYATRALGSSQATLASLQTLVRRTDASLNGSVLPSLAASLNEQNQALSGNQARLGANLDELKTTTKALRQMVEDADGQISSPDIKASLDNLTLSSKDMATGMANLAGVTKDAKDAADFELAQLKKPANFWLGVLKFVLNYGSDARVLFTGGVK